MKTLQNFLRKTQRTLKIKQRKERTRNDFELRNTQTITVGTH